MLKNILIGILAITAALAISALAWDSLNESDESLVAQSKASVIVDNGERDSIITASGVHVPHYYEYGPTILAIGDKAPHYYEYGPAILAIGFARPNVTSFQTPQTSNYVESISLGAPLAASQAGQSSAMNVVDNISSALQLNASQAGQSNAMNIVDNRVTGIPSDVLQLVPQLAASQVDSDDQYPALSSSYLIVVSTYHDR